MINLKKTTVLVETPDIESHKKLMDAYEEYTEWTALEGQNPKELDNHVFLSNFVDFKERFRCDDSHFLDDYYEIVTVEEAIDKLKKLSEENGGKLPQDKLLAVSVPTYKDCNKLMEVYEKYTEWRWVTQEKPTDGQENTWDEEHSYVCMSDEFVVGTKTESERVGAEIITLDEAIKIIKEAHEKA